MPRSTNKEGEEERERKRKSHCSDVKVQPTELPVAAIQGVSSQHRCCVFIFLSNKQTGCNPLWSAGRSLPFQAALTSTDLFFFFQAENDISLQE